MAHPRNNPHNLTEAIRRLEAATENGHNSNMNEDIKSIRQAIDELKPHLAQFKDDVKNASQGLWNEQLHQARETFEKSKEQVKELSHNVDKKVHDNPWWAMGIVGILALFVGYLLGRKD